VLVLVLTSKEESNKWHILRKTETKKNIPLTYWIRNEHLRYLVKELDHKWSKTPISFIQPQETEMYLSRRGPVMLTSFQTIARAELQS
jgi:hypothetical protein